MSGRTLSLGVISIANVGVYIQYFVCAMMNIPLHWPRSLTDFLLDGVVFLPDLSQVGPHADERVMDRLLCLVPALLSSSSFLDSVFFFSLTFLVAPPPLKRI